MKNLAPDSGQHKPLVRREIELDLRPSARARRGRYRSAIADPALTTAPTATVHVNVEAELVVGNHEARFVGDPCDDLAEDTPEKAFVEMTLADKSEVDVFGESIGLEVALLQARPSFKYPRLRNVTVRIDPRKQPSENIVLLEDIRQQAER